MLAAACTPGGPTAGGDRAGAGPAKGSSRSDKGTGGRAGPHCAELAKLVARVRRGWVPLASPDISLIPREPNYVGPPSAPVHSGPWDYLAEVPLVVYGPGYLEPRGRVRAPATMADLAPTTARLVGFDGWPRRRGRVLEDVAGSAPRRPPRLVVTIVWDGGGWNVLQEHRDAWPFLERLTRAGTSFTDMTIGSSPSVTPPVHTTLGTGTFPNVHGIPALRVRTRQNTYPDPFEGFDPSRIRVATLADLYDRAMGNRPVTGAFGAVNWHLGMIGQGRGHPGGDADPVVLLNEQGETLSNTHLYTLPEIDDPAALERATAQLDARDGELDGRWRGHSLEVDTNRYASPAHVAYQQHLLERFIAVEDFGDDPVPDLLYVNFKTTDDAGHTFGMTSPETAEAVGAQDRALARLTRYLDGRVGRGRWVVMVTADHGQTPFPFESHGWAISGGELRGDAARVFDHADNGIELIESVKSAGIYIRRDDLRPNNVSLAAIARWVADYRAVQNLRPGARFPSYFAGDRDTPLFDGVMVNRRLAATPCPGFGG